MRNAVRIVALGALVFVATPQHVPAQTSSRNAAYIELLGSGGLYSLNVERRVRDVHIRVGFASWSFDDSFGAGETDMVTVPFTLSHVRGRDNHHLESGGGFTLGHRTFTSAFGEPTTSSGFVTLTGLVGYRYQKPGPGFIFRALFTPLLGLGDDDVAYPDRGFTPTMGISFGYAF